MNNQEAIEMLTAKAECIRREASGIDVDCNHRNCDECDLCYKQGTMGDQMEALGVAISALQAQEAKHSTFNQLATDTISRTAAISELMEWVGEEEQKSWSIFKGRFHWTEIKSMLECLPPAQQELYREDDAK
jgi:hypothetical protein